MHRFSQESAANCGPMAARTRGNPGVRRKSLAHTFTMPTYAVTQVSPDKIRGRVAGNLRVIVGRCHFTEIHALPIQVGTFFEQGQYLRSAETARFRSSSAGGEGRIQTIDVQ